MTHLSPRPWVPAACETHVQTLATTATQPSAQVADRIEALIQANLQIHDQDCFNLNPATNVMNPKAEAALGARSRVPAQPWLPRRQVRNGA